MPVFDTIVEHQLNKISLTELDKLMYKPKIALIPKFLLKKICNKTGRFFGWQDFDEIERCIQTHGLERTIVILNVRFIQNVCADWVYIDHIALDELETKDPVGYYMYAGSQCSKHTFELTTDHIVAKNESYNKISRDFENPHKRQNIVRCNVLFQRILSAQTPKSLSVNLEPLDKQEFENPIEAYTKVMLAWSDQIKKTKKLKGKFTIKDYYAEKYTEPGSTNFRKQRHDRKRDMIAIEVAAMFDSTQFKNINFERARVDVLPADAAAYKRKTVTLSSINLFGDSK